ncbi:MAG: alpha/beta hydrolase [Massilia sp.]
MKKSNIGFLAFGATVLALGTLAACSPVKTINALTPIAGADIPHNIAYGANPRYRLDIYRPAGNAIGQPVVVFFYGGNWTSGERANYAFIGRALAARGIVAVIPDYRLYPEVSYPDFLDDSAAALAWTQREITRFGGDPRQLFAMGHSAGAYNASMLALDAQWLRKQGSSPAALRGWIGLAGPYDFLPIENKTARPVFHFPNTPPESQPVRHVSAGAPPALLIAASDDKLVNPTRNTGNMARLLRERGVPVTERYYDHLSHTLLIGSISAPLRLLAPTLDDIERFVKSPPAAARQP